VYQYPPNYGATQETLDVRARLIRFHTVMPAAPPRTINLYFLNYDRLEEHGRAIIFASTGGFLAPVALGLEMQGGYSAASLGRLAASGLPLMIYEEPGSGQRLPTEDWESRLYSTAADLRLIDRTTLKQFDSVDLLGGCASLAPLLASHESRITSAYISGQCIPLWTRNDTHARTGGPFSSDPDTDHVLFQSRFQWADFLVMAAANGVELALAMNAGGSGLGKAGVLYEMMPALRRLGIRFEVRGDDRNGDGEPDSGRLVCNDYDAVDFVHFVKTARQRRVERQAVANVPRAEPRNADR
jgi:hypothetical protein